MSMSTIAQTAAITSGSVNILHPLEMMRQMRLIAQNPVIATDVQVKLIMPPYLELQDEWKKQVITVIVIVKVLVVVFEHNPFSTVTVSDA